MQETFTWEQWWTLMQIDPYIECLPYNKYLQRLKRFFKSAQFNMQEICIPHIDIDGFQHLERIGIILNNLLLHPEMVAKVVCYQLFSLPVSMKAFNICKFFAPIFAIFAIYSNIICNKFQYFNILAVQKWALKWAK